MMSLHIQRSPEDGVRMCLTGSITQSQKARPEARLFGVRFMLLRRGAIMNFYQISRTRMKSRAERWRVRRGQIYRARGVGRSGPGREVDLMRSHPQAFISPGLPVQMYLSKFMIEHVTECRLFFIDTQR